MSQYGAIERISNSYQGLFSPLQSFYHVYFSALDTTAQMYDPVVKTVARVQLEALGFMTRRSQEMMKLPMRMAECRSPLDVVNEQVRFWQTAHQQSAETARKMFEAALPFTSQKSFEFDREPKAAHDYITFPEYREIQRPAERREERLKVA